MTDREDATEEARRLRAELVDLRARHDRLQRDLAERDGAIMSDLRAAQRFQRSILPPPPSMPGIEFEALYLPLDLVGGDIYDITVLDSERVRIFLADATGHGVTASLTTMFIKSEYEIIKRSIKTPVGVLRVLNERIARATQHLQMRFTAICLNVDVKKGTLTYASAAHPAPCLVRAGAAIELETGGPFMGMLPDVPFPESRVDFRPGDAVFAFTDGLTEVAGSDGKPFGEQRVYQALTEAQRSNRSARDTISASLREFIGKGPGRADDLTLVGLRWTGIELPSS